VFQAFDYQDAFFSVGVEGRPVLTYRAVAADEEWAQQVPSGLTVDNVKAALLKITFWTFRCLTGDYGMVSHQLPVADRGGGPQCVPAYRVDIDQGPVGEELRFFEQSGELSYGFGDSLWQVDWVYAPLVSLIIAPVTEPAPGGVGVQARCQRP
jgi:hypothetical protein